MNKNELRDWERCGKSREHSPHMHVAIFNEGPTAPLYCDGKPKGSPVTGSRPSFRTEITYHII